MGSGIWRSPRALAVAALLTALAASAAGAASPSGDSTIARTGVLVAADFPAGFTPSTASGSSHADNVKLAKGVDGCAPYVALQKALIPLPQAKSPKFDDASRSISNEVDVFPTDKAASAALVLYAKSSMVGCLESLFEKQIRQGANAQQSIDDVMVDLNRQDIADLGDESVVYEGSVALTGTDGAQSKLGIGAAAVRVGRAVDVVSYSTAGTSLTDVLTPAIDASVARLRTALARPATATATATAT